MSSTYDLLEGPGFEPALDDSAVFETPPLQLGARTDHRSYLRSTFENPDFLIRYPLTILRAKYRDTLLGLGWEILNPILLVAVWWIIRGVAFPDAGGPDYLAFLIVGIFTYQYMQRFVVNGAASVNSARGLMQSFNFPALVAPIQHAVGIFVSNLIAVIVMLAFVILTGIMPMPSWLLVLPIVVAQSTFAFGGSLILARITVHSPDVRNVVPFIFRLLFYASGIIFPIGDRITDSALRTVFDLNPFFAITAVTRSAVIGSPLGGLTLASALAWSALTPIVGYLIFRAGDETYAG